MAGPNGTGLLDDFNRANADPAGGNWSTPAFPGDNSLAVVSNALKRGSAGAASWGSAYWNAATFGPDCEAYIDWTTIVSPFELLLRLATPGVAGVDGYMLDVTNAGVWSFWRIDNNNQVQLGANISQAVAAGSSIGFSAVGSTLTAWYRPSGGSWTNLGTRTDATYSAAGNIGVVINQLSNVLDNFGGGTISSSTPISGTDTGTDAEASSLTAQLAGTQAAGDAEVTSQTAQISGTDTSTDSESASIGNTPISGTDTGTDAEASSLAAAIPGAEAASDAEATSLRLAGSDTATDSEINVLSAQLPGADSGTETDVTKIALSGAADSGSDSELSALQAALGGSESATAGETASNGAPVSASDAGTSVQNAALVAVTLGTDFGTAAEIISNISRVSSTTDTASVVEAILQAAFLGSADAGSSIEVVLGKAVFILLDSGSSIENASAVQAPFVSGDTGTITEGAVVSFGGGILIHAGAPHLLLEADINAQSTLAEIGSAILLSASDGRAKLVATLVSASPTITETDVD